MKTPDERNQLGERLTPFDVLRQRDKTMKPKPVKKEGPVKAPRAWKAKRTCPRCGGSPDLYTELYKGTEARFMALNGLPATAGTWDFGEPYGIRARCGSCGNEWRLKGFQSIQQLKP